MIDFSNLSAVTQDDTDVARERERIETLTTTSSELVIVKDLTKVYKTKANPRLVAVKKLSIGMQAGECFGLLGVNGMRLIVLLLLDLIC